MERRQLVNAQNNSLSVGHTFRKAPKGCKCLGGLSAKCGGDLYTASIFYNGVLSIPLCDNHINDHRYIMSLYHAGYDIKKVVKMHPNKIKKLALSIGLCDWKLI